MRIHFLFIALCLVISAGAADAFGQPQKVVIVVHGGTADKNDRQEMTPELEKDYRRGLEAAAKAGYEKLKKHGSSLDAVEAPPCGVLEDDPMFNAGKGAVFSHEGKNELDAGIMDGKTMKAGAVASVTVIKNPISAARAIMEKTRHVLLVSKGAEQFAKEARLDIVDPSYFYTEKRWQDLQKALKKEEALKKEKADKSSSFAFPRQTHWGTVGAVALDDQGNLAAGTSTGGLTNKRYGRVGDSPIMGGWDLRRQRRRGDLLHGCRRVLHSLRRRPRGRCVGQVQRLSNPESGRYGNQRAIEIRGRRRGADRLDPKGNLAISSNSEGIFHAWVTEDGAVHSGIFTK